MKERIIFVAGLIVLAAVGFYVVTTYASSPPEQPVAFSHQKHVDKVECSFCHQHLQQEELPGLPSVERCMACHQAPVSESPEAQKVREYAERGEEIPWVKLFGLVDHAIFSHQAHLSRGIECSTCHGEVRNTDTPTQGFGRKGAIGPYGMRLMNFCTSCHEQQGASVDCLTCHN